MSMGFGAAMRKSRDIVRMRCGVHSAPWRALGGSAVGVRGACGDASGSGARVDVMEIQPHDGSGRSGGNLARWRALGARGWQRGVRQCRVRGPAVLSSTLGSVGGGRVGVLMRLCRPILEHCMPGRSAYRGHLPSQNVSRSAPGRGCPQASGGSRRQCSWREGIRMPGRIAGGAGAFRALQGGRSRKGVAARREPGSRVDRCNARAGR
jgi:hypothetical protein